ncbi:MAG: hypothetical protein AVDCRST_MAG51-2861 [uncultured Ramlibacter sp.]|uniref:Uncharacterized protein n=1 Tax=uncultured Ramlibacter sp. TaxID=260755 RepID=A0A6J4QDD8_9BURK|nr:MAG: hypothetical protein AVDCRST_MAG51-2861 [uncultured Ramlibacter sp.]
MQALRMANSAGAINTWLRPVALRSDANSTIGSASTSY